MKLCQFYTSAEDREADMRRRMPIAARLGVLIDGRVVDVTELAVGSADPQALGVQAAVIACDPIFASLRSDIAGLSADDGLRPDDLFFAPPIVRPSQFLDFYAFEQHVRTARKLRGLNFVVPEWYEIPAYYNSNPTSLAGHGMTIRFPAGEEKMDFECELACIIGRPVRNATPASAAEAIAGYAILNDFSSRTRQMRAMTVGMGPAPGKDFASAMGPYLVTRDEIDDLAALGMHAYVNGEQWTDACYGGVHHSFEKMIAYASASRWLYPGDVLGSGTVGGGCGLELGRFLEPGDVVRLEIDGLGVLENRVEHDE